RIDGQGVVVDQNRDLCLARILRWQLAIDDGANGQAGDLHARLVDEACDVAKDRPQMVALASGEEAALVDGLDAPERAREDQERQDADLEGARSLHGRGSSNRTAPEVSTNSRR